MIVSQAFDYTFYISGLIFYVEIAGRDPGRTKYDVGSDVICSILVVGYDGVQIFHFKYIVIRRGNVFDF